MAKFILNKGFNHVEDGVIDRYEAGQDVSHLSDVTKDWLTEKGHAEEVEDDETEAPKVQAHKAKAKGKK